MSWILTLNCSKLHYFLPVEPLGCLVVLSRGNFEPTVSFSAELQILAVDQLLTNGSFQNCPLKHSGCVVLFCWHNNSNHFTLVMSFWYPWKLPCIFHPHFHLY
mgnify:CR=1 FL=1